MILTPASTSRVATSCALAPGTAITPTTMFFSPSPLIIKDPTNPGAVYAYLQGTSMAAPHVTGTAALVVSRYGHMAPGAVEAILNSTADPLACPPNPFNPGPPFNFLAICEGGPAYNGFYGHGEVNALSAITK